MGNRAAAPIYRLVQKGFLFSEYVNNLLATAEAVPFQRRTTTGPAEWPSPC